MILRTRRQIIIGFGDRCTHHNFDDEEDNIGKFANKTLSELCENFDTPLAGIIMVVFILLHQF